MREKPELYVSKNITKYWENSSVAGNKTSLEEMLDMYEHDAILIIDQYDAPNKFGVFEKDFCTEFGTIMMEDSRSEVPMRADFWNYTLPNAGCRQLMERLAAYVNGSSQYSYRWKNSFTLSGNEDYRSFNDTEREMQSVLETMLSGTQRVLFGDMWLEPGVKDCVDLCNSISDDIEKKNYDLACEKMCQLLLHKWHELRLSKINRTIETGTLQDLIKLTHGVFMKDGAKRLQGSLKQEMLHAAIFNLNLPARVINNYEPTLEQAEANGNEILKDLTLRGRYDEVMDMMRYDVSTEFMRCGIQVNILQDVKDEVREPATKWPKNINLVEQLVSILERRNLTKSLDIKENTSSRSLYKGVL